MRTRLNIINLFLKKKDKNNNIKGRRTFSSSDVGVHFPSSMPESELDVLVETLLSDLPDSERTSSGSLSDSSPWSSRRRFWRGRGTGAAGPTASASAGAAYSFLGEGMGVVVLGVAGPVLVGDWSPSELI